MRPGKSKRKSPEGNQIANMNRSNGNVFRNMRIRNKALLLFVIAGLIPLVLVSVFSYTQTRQAMIDQVSGRLESTTGQLGTALSTYFVTKQYAGEVLASTRDSNQGVLTYIQYGANSSDWKTRYTYLDTVMPIATKRYGFDSIFLTDSTGHVIYASAYKSDLEGVDLSIRAYVQSSLKGQENWAPLFYSQFLTHNCMVFSAPIFANSTSGKVIGTINFIINQQTLDDTVHVGIEKIGKTADSYLVAPDGTLLTEMMHGQFTTDAALKQKLNTDVVRAVSDAISSNSTSTNTLAYQNYAAVPVLGAFQVVKMGDSAVGLVTEINQDEAYASLTTLQNALFVAVGAAIAIGAITSLYIARALSNPVIKLLSVVKEVGKGNLTVKPEVASRDEIGHLSAVMDDMILSNARLIGTIKASAAQISTMAEQYASSSKQVASTAQQLATGAEQIAKGATDQATAAQNTTGLMEQMTAKSKEIVEASEFAIAGAREDTINTVEGLKAAKDAQLKMNEINASSVRAADVVKGLVGRSKEIGQTATVITGIADQTNLLALNAAIEAARAGEHGRGFAVVAEEVRKLAEESKKAADQIAKLNDEIQSDTGAAVKAIEDNAVQSNAGVQVINDRVLATLQNVKRTAEQAEASITAIGDASKKQLEFANQVSTAMSSVAAASEEASATTEEFSASIEEINASVEESTAGAQELSGIVKRLNDLVNQYRVELDPETNIVPDASPHMQLSADKLSEPGTMPAIRSM